MIFNFKCSQEVFKYEILRNFGQIKAYLLNSPISLKDLLEYFLLNFEEIPKEKRLFHLENLDVKCFEI